MGIYLMLNTLDWLWSPEEAFVVGLFCSFFNLDCVTNEQTPSV